MLKSILLVTLSIGSLTVAGFGQSQQQLHAPKAISPLATSDCQSTFTSGSGINFLQFCVTANGNITEFQSPAGVEHIREGAFAEGYGVCDFSSSNRYFDWADDGDSGNWQAPVRTQPNGPNTFPLKIVRTTSDGIYTLTQSYSQTPGERFVKFVMTLKNQTAVARDFALVRYADIDANNADGGDFVNIFDFDHESAWGYNRGFNDYGLMISAVPTTMGEFAFAQTLDTPPDPCSPGNDALATFTGDGSVGVDWNGTLDAHKQVTVTGEYKRF